LQKRVSRRRGAVKLSETITGMLGHVTAKDGVTFSETAAPWFEPLRREQIASLYRNSVVGIPAAWIAAGVLAALLLYLDAVALNVAAIWFGIVTLQTAARLALSWAHRRAQPIKDWRRWGDWFTWGCVAGGLVWGVGTLFLMDPARFDLQMLIVVLITGLVYGGLSSFGSWMPAFYGFFLPALAPSAVWSLAQGDAAHVAYGLLAAIWIPAVATLARRYNRSFVQSLRLAFENAALAEDLQRQKEIADEANAAKSRFLASASHDLRQPVHALGLFVGALKAEPLDAAPRRLVDQIDETVDGLDGLFTALLDVSRLDAGVVRAEPRPTPVWPMLQRLVGELKPAAEAKQLRLRLRGGEHWVQSDPILLERIARNLLSNAVRHTRRGGVLVALRVGPRDEAWIEVWDTGPGIDETQRGLVFQEFYQIAGSERSSESGLGLGLAIVRRLADLLGHRLELHSVPGRGSMFRLRVPLALPQAPSSAPREAADGAPRALIWVIDDEAAARAGMDALLTSWEHEVVTAASGAEMLAKHVADTRTPHLILCDYRLASEDGISVVRTLRARLSAPVPAALITGDTGPDRLREAAASGLPLLHKPVSKARLRALIGNLLRAPAL
jgi:two-component system, sensor histidine kinase